MLASLTSQTPLAVATLVLALALTTLPALLALGGAALVSSALLVGAALRAPEPAPARARVRR
jgi:hypothetical protein